MTPPIASTPVPPAGPKAPATTPAPAPAGNPLSYHVPKVAGTSPIPVQKISKKTLKPYLVKKKSFLADHFSTTQRAPFGKKRTLPGHRVFSKIDILRCVVDCGYGLSRNWTAALAVSPFPGPTLATYLLQRLRLMATCVERGPSGEYLVSPFFEFLEPTEKGDLSFNLGSLGTNLASRIWLRAAGETMTSFLHAGILDASLADLNLALAAPGRKSPDYLVGTNKHRWHLFESKGGSADDAVSRIAEGLFQLHGTYRVKSPGRRTTAVASYVCVHTSVDPGTPLRLQVVDPPDAPDPPESPETPEGAEVPKPAIEIDFIPEVARLLSLLESIDLFDAMTGEEVDITRGPMAGWTVARTTVFEGASAAIPTVYRTLEDPMRIRISRFLAVRRVQERSWAVHGTLPHGKPLVEAVKNHLEDPSDDPDLPASLQDFLAAFSAPGPGFYAGIEALEPGADFLARCSAALHIDDLDQATRRGAEEAYRAATRFSRERRLDFSFTTNRILLSEQPLDVLLASGSA